MEPQTFPPIDPTVRNMRASALTAQDEQLYEGRVLTISAGDGGLVQLAEDVAVQPDAVTALVERCYRKDGVPTYSVDVHVAGSRAPIIVEDRRLAELLEALRRA